MKWLKSIVQLWNTLVSFFTQGWSKIVNFKNQTLNLLNTIQQIVDGVNHFIDGVKNFDIQPHWKNRVISVPSAVEEIKRLLTEVPGEIVDAVRQLADDVKSTVDQFSADPAEITDIEKVPGKLGEALGKLLEWISLVITALTTIEDTLNQILTIVNDLNEILDDLNHLDGIFLQQNNKRKWTTERIHARVRS